jgi:hypothetical protein
VAAGNINSKLSINENLRLSDERTRLDRMKEEGILEEKNGEGESLININCRDYCVGEEVVRPRR